MQQEISYVQLSILKLVKKSIQFMGENLVNHCLLRYTKYTTIQFLCSTLSQTQSNNHFNCNSIQNVQQLNCKFTNESSLITCENLINHRLLRYTEYHNIKSIQPVHEIHLQLKSKYKSNRNEMRYASR